MPFTNMTEVVKTPVAAGSNKHNSAFQENNQQITIISKCCLKRTGQKLDLCDGSKNIDRFTLG